METVHYEEKGSGPPIILLHGFPLNHNIWNTCSANLSKSFRVVTPDLPGFGKSKILKEGFTIADVASYLIDWIVNQNIVNPVIVGHSLGGYVALAMAQQRPELFKGLVLFHSTAYPDSAEKKESRDKVIEFIDKNGVLAFTSNFIQPLFSNQSHPAITFVREIAVLSSSESVIGYTKAMKNRPDLTSVLKNFRKPILIIAGEKDGGISVESVLRQKELSENVDVAILKNVAHMGMFEDPETTSIHLLDFVGKSNQP